VLVRQHTPVAQDRSGVELGVHAMEGEADPPLAFPDRPGDRDRASVFREQPEVTVHRAETRDGERIWRDLPRKARAEEQIGVVGSEERSDPASAGGDHDVETLRRTPDELLEGPSEAVGVLPRA
jgi:hypothetical protein